MNKKRSHAAFPQRETTEGSKVDVHQDVTVNHHERLGQQIPDLVKAARGPQRLAFHDMVDPGTEASPVPKVPLDRFGHVAGEKDEIDEAIANCVPDRAL